MRLLAFETATSHISVALWQDGVCTERSAELPNSGAEVLLPWANELLAGAGIGLKQIDGIAFGAGPGGFTGLRLACGVAQGLAWGLDIPVLPVSTLAALARNAGDGDVWAVLDARMNEVYAGFYRVLGDEVSELAPVHCAAPEHCAVPPRLTFATGDGLAAYPALLSCLPGDSQCRSDCWPTAAAVARLAALRLLRGEGLPAASAQPIYVRDKVALTTAERLARGGVR